jgi:hypothetical protein
MASLLFYTPTYDESAERAFGCASAGFAGPEGWVDPRANAKTEWPDEVEGILLHGSLDRVRAEVSTVSAAVKGGIVLFGNCGREESLLGALNERFPGAPFAGGSAAVGEDGRVGRLLPANGEVSLLLITDERYDLAAQFENVHQEIVAEAQVCGDEPRHVRDVVLRDGSRVSYDELLHQIAARKGAAAGLTERITLSAPDGRNIHLSPAGPGYLCGANLPQDRHILVRYTDKHNVYARMRAFYADSDAIIFGCAGLRSMLDDQQFPAGGGSLGLFMHGEVAMIGGQAQFANLTLSKLKLMRR